VLTISADVTPSFVVINRPSVVFTSFLIGVVDDGFGGSGGSGCGGSGGGGTRGKECISAPPMSSIIIAI